MTQFIDRLERLSEGRALYTWLMNIGVVRSSVNRVKTQGGKPTDALITALQKCENVSRNWLIEEKGSPYIVHDVVSDDEAEEDIRAHLEDEPWSVYLVKNYKNNDFVIVLTLPCTYQTQRKKEIAYTAIEVIPHCGQKALSAATELAPDFYVLVTDDQTLSDLKSGKMGTYHLINADNGLLHQAEKTTLPRRKSLLVTLFGSAAVADKNSYSVREDTEISPQDRELLEKFNKLSLQNRQALLVLINNLD